MTHDAEADQRTPLGRWPVGKDGRKPNLNPEFIADMEKRLGLKFVSQGPLSGPTAIPRLKEGRVYINKVPVAAIYDCRKVESKIGDGTSPLQQGQYFEGVPPEVWNFHIGGY